MTRRRQRRMRVRYNKLRHAQHVCAGGWVYVANGYIKVRWVDVSDFEVAFAS